ncbi:MAG: energy-coupling factor transporter transmembrane protein EcfT [Bacteroidetes bacterium]|nr:energy-coupling factor transporter transmembrane protein EcfT [Bacteroidota bacterium]
MKFLIPVIILTVIILPSEYVIPFGIVVMIGYAMIDSSQLHLFKRKSLYTLFTIVVIIQPMILGSPTSEVFGVSFSAEALVRGFAMFIRALVIISSITYLNRNTEKEKVKEFWKRQGMENFDVVLAKAQEVLPTIKISFSDSIKAVKKEGTGKSWLRSPAELLARLVVPLLHKSNTVIPEKKIKEA